MTQPADTGRPAGRTGNRPVYTVRYGHVKAAIWRNIVDMGNNSRPMYSVTFSRSYKDGDAWKDSGSFGPDDLLVLAKAANDAHTFVCGARNTGTEQR
jgi:hypothetical protein